MGIARRFIGESSALDAPINTSLLSAIRENSQPAKGKITIFSTAEILPTPILVEKLAVYLEGYDAQPYQELVPGFVYGFRLYFQGTPNVQFSSNLQSALQN